MPFPSFQLKQALLLAAAIVVAVGIRLPGFFPEATRTAAATFLGHDGRQHVYLGGYDSYYWLKLARTTLSTGTPCDRIDREECIDADANAPVGEVIDYRHSPHVAAIAGMQRLLSRLDPRIPLSTSAMIVPVVLAAAGALAAYVLGALAAGPAGGIIAALLVSCNPVVLGRTLEGDDDIWVVVLPLFIFCALALALRATNRPGRVLWSIVAGALLGLTAAAWEGWPFFACAAIAGVAIAGVVRRDLNAVLILVILCVISVPCAIALGVRPDLAGIAAQAERFAGIAGHATGLVTAPLPNTFAAIAELRAADVSMLVTAFGAPAFALGLAGFAIVLAVERAPSRMRVPAALSVVVAAVGCTIGLALAHAGKLAILAVVFFALSSVLVFRRGSAVARGFDPVWYLLVTWLAMSFFIAFDALRYVMLAAVPLAVIAGASAGTLIRALAAPRTAPAIWRAAGAAAIACIVVAAAAPAIAQGNAVTHAQSPEINAAWIETLHAIRDDEPKSTIVDVWWDRGHWAKYYARRPVSNDGATLRNSTNYWLALSLSAPSAAESVRYLRMLDCGEVVDPSTGERARPYETLTHWFDDDATAYRTLSALMHSSAARHRAVLAKAGLGPRRITALLRTVDCTPPPAVLLVSSKLLSDESWYLDGFWDPYRAFLIAAAHDEPARAAADAAERYGRSLTETRALIGAAAAVQNEAQRDTFAAPQGRVLDTAWSPCAMGRAILRCPTPAGTVYADPTDAAHVALVDGSARLPLSLVEVVRPGGIATIVPRESDPNAPAAIVDAARMRVFVGMPAVVHSTLVRLLLLNGAGQSAFVLAAMHTAPNGELVSSWRVRWDRADVERDRAAR